MDGRHERDLVLQLRRAGDTITGVIRDEDGSVLPFMGWIGLTSVIERLASEIGDQPAPSADRLTR